MSAEHVALVRGLLPAPERDIAAMFRDDALATRVIARMAPSFHEDFETVLHSGSEQIRYHGVAGLRSAWLKWLAPWATYRTEIGELIDAGSRVVATPQDFARLEATGPEVKLDATSIWTVEEGKVRKAEFYSDRETGLRAAGLLA